MPAQPGFRRLPGAFFIATAFFTWRQIRVSERQLRTSEDE
jgi:hypothetical protein